MKVKVNQETGLPLCLVRKVQEQLGKACALHRGSDSWLEGAACAISEMTAEDWKLKCVFNQYGEPAYYLENEDGTERILSIYDNSALIDQYVAAAKGRSQTKSFQIKKEGKP